MNQLHYVFSNRNSVFNILLGGTCKFQQNILFIQFNNLSSFYKALRHNGGRILNGDPGSIRPFQLYLQAFNETDDNMDYGAGVLIAPRVVLTVATLIKGYVQTQYNFAM